MQLELILTLILAVVLIIAYITARRQNRKLRKHRKRILDRYRQFDEDDEK